MWKMSNYIFHIRYIMPIKNKARKSKSSRSEDLNINLMLSDFMRNKRNKKNCIVVNLHHEEDHEALGTNLLQRLSKKYHTLLMRFDEFKETCKNMQFTDRTQLYITAHGCPNLIGEHNGKSLAEAFGPILENTNIQTIKLASCHSADKVDREFVEKHFSVESLYRFEDKYVSLTEEFSETLGRLAIKNVKVYGYHGTMVEGKLNKEYHTIVTDGKGTRLRASEARTCFINGKLNSSTLSCNFYPSSLITDSLTDEKIQMPLLMK